MEYKDIVNLIKLVSKSSLSEVKIREGDFEISIRTEKYSKPMKEGQLGTTTFLPTAPGHLSTPATVGASQPVESETTVVATESSGGTPAPVEESEVMSEDLIEIKSPIVGTFYRASSPDKAPYLKVGDTVEPGMVVCIVEAMKLFNEIESEVSGKVVKVMVEDAQPVDYDQVLFLLDPKG